MSKPDMAAERPRRLPGPLGAVLLLLIVSVLSLLIGSQPVAPATVLDALTSFDPADAEHVVVRTIRLPRTIVGLLAGLALGAAGALMQALTRNPLAEPGVLGVNAGAGAAVAVTTALVAVPGPAQTVPAAMAGAAVSGTVVLVIGGALSSRPDPVRLVLAGAAMSVVLGSVSSALVLTYPHVFAQFRYWDAGAVVHRPWSLIAVGGVLLGIALVLGLLAARALDALALGDELGQALGASPLRTWVLAGTAAVILCGTATALAGPIAFIGLAAPLIARALVGERQRDMIGISSLLAASLLLASDVLGRVIVRPAEVQASIVAALLGAPIFLAVVRRGRAAGLR